jgi:hypothetical protein
MKDKIKLYNRDGADLWLKKCNKQIEPNIWMWYLDVDKEHSYILDYCRYIGDNFLEPEAIDPSGGPMLSLGDEFEEKYKIVKINSINNIWISERNNN